MAALLLCPIFHPSVFGQTGLFYTPEELAIWNQRRLNGPYKDHWDNKIFYRAQQFVTGAAESSPWAGQPADSCWNSALPGRTFHSCLRDAAFVYRVFKYAGDAKAGNYFTPVRNALLAQIAEPGTNFADTSRFCKSSYSKDGSIHDIVNWVRRFAIAYSFIREDLSSADRQKIDAWLLTAARFWEKHVEWYLSYRFSNRYNDAYVCDRSYCPGPEHPETPLYYGAPMGYTFHGGWNNRVGTVNAMMAVVGGITGDTTLKSQSKRWVKETLMFAVWPNGVYVDQNRWNDYGNPTQGHGYPLTAVGSLITIVDVLARGGDTELYTFSTTKGRYGTEVTSGPPKSLLSLMKHYGGQVDGSVIEYASKTPTTDPALIIDSEIPPSAPRGEAHTIYDMVLVQANVFYRDNYIKGIYTRTGPGTPPYPSNPSTGGYDVYSGDWGSYPNVLFMFGQMEGQVWPYPGNPPSINKGKRLSQNAFTEIQIQYCNAGSKIRIALPLLFNTREARISIHNVCGSLVKVLLNPGPSMGKREIVWEGTNIHGKKAGNGIYLVRLRQGDQFISSHFLFLK